MNEIAGYLEANKKPHEDDYHSFKELFESELQNTVYTTVRILFAGCQRAASYLSKDLKLEEYAESSLTTMISDPAIGGNFSMTFKNAKAAAIIHSIYRFEKLKRYKTE